MDIEPVLVEPKPVAVAADLSTLGLEDGKAYEVTLTVDTKGNQTAVVTELAQGIDEPANGLIVIRSKVDGSVFLGQYVTDWYLHFDHFKTWQEVLNTFSSDLWDYLTVGG